MKLKILVINSGGDCPGINAVIRAIVKRAHVDNEHEIIGSINGFEGILNEPLNLLALSKDNVSGIIKKGGTILTTNNNKDPFNYPVVQKDGSIEYKDLSEQLIYNIRVLNFDAVLHIGGNKSHKISLKLFEKGINIIGIPKTINNDLSITNYSFGFQTAAQIATEAVDKLITTARSHNRILILEVMGRDAGWIALHAAIAGGADACLIPEIEFTMDKVVEKLKSKFNSDGRGYAIVVVAEGAFFMDENGSKVQGNIARKIGAYLKTKNLQADIRETILGHLQRGGSPNAFDRILATELGVKSFELAKDKKFGTMAVHQNSGLSYLNLEEVINKYNKVDNNHSLIQTAKGVGISFGE